MLTVSSRRHPLVQALRTARTARDGPALIDGWHLLEDAVAAGLEIEGVAIGPAHVNGRARALIDGLTAARVEVAHVTAGVMDTISPVRSPTGVVALVRPRRATIDVLAAARDPRLILVGVDLQDPGNVGSVVRASEAGGATGVVLTGEAADPWQWKALRAAMGSTFRLPVVREPDTLAACATLRALGLRLLATVPRGGTALHDEDLSSPCAIVFGSEGAGLTDAVIRACDHQLSIPMTAPVESLNVAVAAGVVVYEARRQRTAARREPAR